MRVVVCDERRAVREGLERVLAGVPGVEDIEGVGDGDELLTCFAQHHVDVVAVGTQRAVPTGIEATRRLLATHPHAGVLVFGAPDDHASIAAAVSVGVRGYLGWNTSLIEVIAAVAAMTLPVVPRTALGLPERLTLRELQVLQGMAQGQSNRRIGRPLYLAEDTVKTHANRLFRKMGASSRAHAVAHGLRYGLID